MGLNRKISDENSIDKKTNKKQQIMEMSTLTTSGRRWTSRVVENVNDMSDTRLPTSSESTRHQKVRRIIEEEKWKKNNKKNIVIKNYNITSKKSELFDIDNYKYSSDYKKYKNTDCDNIKNNNYYKFKKLNNYENNIQNNNKLLLKTKNIKDITKTSNISTNFKQGTDTSVKKKLQNDGILKKSSAFLERLTGDKKNNIIFNKNSTIKRINNDIIFLNKSTSCQSLTPNSHNNNNNNKRVGVKKSVSFSSDTTFEGVKLNSLKKITVHEAKIYSKGVLQDLNDINTLKKSNIKIEEKEMSLLRAAKESDELSLNDLITKICKSGIGQVDVNATDSSGRSVISYIAGNGASDILETVLKISGSNPNIPDNEGNTPLHFAAQAGQAECLNILLQKNNEIELDARNIHGFTPLMKAAIQGRTKCAKILLFAGSNPTLKDHGKGLRAEQWARYCGRHACADAIEKFSRHKLIDRTSCRWGSEPELATKVLQGKIIPIQQIPMTIQSNGIKSKLKRVFRTNGNDKNFSIVSQLTSAAICASTPALPKPGDIQPIVKNLFRPLSVPQLRVTLVKPTEILEKSEIILNDKIDTSIIKPLRNKKKTK